MYVCTLLISNRSECNVTFYSGYLVARSRPEICLSKQKRITHIQRYVLRALMYLHYVRKNCMNLEFECSLSIYEVVRVIYCLYSSAALTRLL